MSDPRWTDETVAAVLAAHDRHTIPEVVGMGWLCACGVALPDYASGRRHLVEVVLSALADAGLLVQPGGTVEVQHRYRDPDGFTMIGFRADQAWRLDATRTVTRWPDGSWHFGPWIPTTQEAPHAR